jgi:hypothetical protein
MKKNEFPNSIKQFQAEQRALSPERPRRKASILDRLQFALDDLVLVQQVEHSYKVPEPRSHVSITHEVPPTEPTTQNASPSPYDCAKEDLVAKPSIRQDMNKQTNSHEFFESVDSNVINAVARFTKPSSSSLDHEVN